MAKIFKCYNCENDKGVPGKDFVAEVPKCPTCGLDGTDKHVAHLIVTCRLIHFNPPHPIAKGVGSKDLACGASPMNAQVTKEIVAANCPACLASEAGRAAARAQALTGDEFDVIVSIDPKNDQYVQA